MAIYHFNQLPSTQSFVRTHPPLNYPLICRANSQTNGYGQRGDNWQSPENQLYFSFRFELPNEPHHYLGLTQQISVALAQTIDPTKKNIKLKWPNDLYLNQKKLAGILLETQPNNNHKTTAYLGIGLNINRQENNDFAYLSDIYSDWRIDIESIFQKIINQLIKTIQQFENKPYVNNEIWEQYDLFFNQTANLEKIGDAKLLGIDQKGRLIAIIKQEIQFLTQTRILTKANELPTN